MVTPSANRKVLAVYKFRIYYYYDYDLYMLYLHVVSQLDITICIIALVFVIYILIYSTKCLCTTSKFKITNSYWPYSCPSISYNRQEVRSSSEVKSEPVAIPMMNVSSETLEAPPTIVFQSRTYKLEEVVVEDGMDGESAQAINDNSKSVVPRSENNASTVAGSSTDYSSTPVSCDSEKIGFNTVGGYEFETPVLNHMKKKVMPVVTVIDPRTPVAYKEASTTRVPNPVDPRTPVAYTDASTTRVVNMVDPRAPVAYKEAPMNPVVNVVDPRTPVALKEASATPVANMLDPRTPVAYKEASTTPVTILK